MRRLIGNVWLRTVAMFLFVMFVYSVVVLLPQLNERARQQLPQKHLVELRTAVNQNYIAYQALAMYQGGTNLDYDTLNSIESTLMASLQKLNSQLKNPPKQISSDIVAQLKATSKSESDIITQYSGRYYALLKPLMYIPESDILPQNPLLAATRAKATFNALDKLANTPVMQLKPAPNNPGQQLLTPVVATFSLPTGVQQLLSESANCFNDLAAQSALHGNDLAGSLKKCATQYKSTRAEIAKLATEPLRSQSGNTIAAELSTAMRQLDQLVIY